MADEDTKEEIKRRVDIVEVISQYVPLQRAGRRYKARCPFHQEKTPSFFVDPANGFWHCFGCGAGGDIFSFLMKIEGISFSEAGERLAQRVGLSWQTQPADKAKAQRRKLLRRAVKIAADHFHDNLHQSGGQPALDYLHQRGFTDEVIEKFWLGYAANQWDDLLKFLGKKGINTEIAQAAGLAKVSRQDTHYDVFRHRVIFPITDAAGAVIGFGGRAMDPDESAKYLNSPDTVLFNKGRNLYALDVARQELVAQKQAIVVEGYTDVIALHQAGISNVVATLGTAMTADHLRLLGRYVDQVILCYDADAAGMQAALRNIDLFERSGLEAKILILPEGTDPDDYVRQHGPEQFAQLTNQAVNLVQYRLEMVFRQYRDQGADGMARAAREAVEVLLKVPDLTRRDEFVARAADRWAKGRPQRAESMQRALQMELRRRSARHTRRRGRPAPDVARDRSFITEAVTRYAEQESPWWETLEKELLSAALEGEQEAERVLEVVQPDDFTSPVHRCIAQALQDQLSTEGQFQPRRIIEELNEEGGTRQRGIELLLASPPADLDEDILQQAAAKLRKHRSTIGLQEEYEIRSDDLLAGGIADADRQDFDQLQTRVAELMESGELTHDHPDYQEFLRLAKMFHGKGQFGFVNDDEAIGGPAPSSVAKDRAVDKDGMEENNQGS